MKSSKKFLDNGLDSELDTELDVELKVDSNGESKESNFLLVSLDDENSKDVANVVGNETCKLILAHLAKKEDTQSGISKELGLPMPTVHYNLQQLQKAGLVIWENYRISEKGKEVHYYKLANKYIIIAPKSEKKEDILSKLRGILPAFAFSLLGAFGIYSYSNLFGSDGSEVASFSQGMIANSVIDSVAKSGARTGIDAASSGAIPLMAETAQVYSDGVIPTDELVQNVTQITTNGSFDVSLFLNEPFMWFLYGAIFALLVVIVWRLVAQKKLRKKIKNK